MYLEFVSTAAVFDTQLLALSAAAVGTSDRGLAIAQRLQKHMHMNM